MKEKRVEVGTVSFSYLYNRKKGEKRGRQHCHDRYEIIYIPKGQGVCIIEGVSYAVKPETLLVLPPLTYHYIEIDADSEFERYLALFSREDLVSEMHYAFSELDVSHTDEQYFCAYDVDGESLSRVLSRFLEEISLPKEAKEQYFRLLVSQLILSVLSEKKRGYYERNESELGARVIRYLGECITKNITLDHLEKYFFVSKYHLCRAFKTHNGISIHGYINHKRVMYAKRLIDAGETAYVAADKVGYGDYSAFYRAFMKIVGESPTAKKRGISNEL